MSWKTELLDLFGLNKKSLVERWTDRVFHAVEQAAGSVGGASDRAGEAAKTVRASTRKRLGEAGELAKVGTRAGRKAVSGSVDAIARRAAEIRERRGRRREERREERRDLRQRRRAVRSRAPMRIDLRRADRIVLRGRRPVDLRMLGGGRVRYRYYERPGFLFRVYLHLTGRRVWPPR
jgi:hypothetical protein